MKVFSNKALKISKVFSNKVQDKYSERNFGRMCYVTERSKFNYIQPFIKGTFNFLS